MLKECKKGGIYHCKNISVISVACVWCAHHEVQGMLPNRSSEDLEMKMLRSFFFN